MIWNGKRYGKGQIIPEAMYEEFIDRSYGTGHNLKETRLWKDTYERGFVCPD